MLASRPAWVARLDELHLLTPLRILAILLVAVVVTLVLRVMVSRLLRRVFAIPGVPIVRAEARQQALATTLRSALVGLVWAAAVITVISEVGVNVGAFVATATVIGGAVAFGAQTLVRDVISGFFVLAEDQYGVGDQVDVGHASGTVERITLRSVRMRDGEGRVWFVPHGNVVRVANLSKSAVALLDVEVARSSDVALVERALHRLSQRLGELVGDELTAEPNVVGLDDVRDDRLVYRVSVATKPSRQDAVRRAWRRAVLEAFRSGELVGPPTPMAPGAPATVGDPPTMPD